MRSVALTTLLFATACASKPDADGDTDTVDTDVVDTGPPAPNHKIELYNYSGNVNTTCAMQLQQLVLTPADGGRAIVRSFVSNPGAESVEWVYVAETDTFLVEVYQTPDGDRIWWDGMAFAPGGTTQIFITGINTGFTENSRCNAISPSGSTLVCGE